MWSSQEDRMSGIAGRQGFTLIELLVVIAIIAMLMAILIPSLNAARQSAFAIKCGANMKNAGIAMSTYVSDSGGFFPASYLYCAKKGKPQWHISMQRDTKYQANGYIHWSYYLFNSGRCDASAFECPAMPHRGISRTNPGPNIDDWEDGQQDMQGSHGPNDNLEDFQAPRMALTGNGAIIIRNKFEESYYGNYSRFNRFVNASQIKRTADVILATEFNKNWKAISEGGSNQSTGLLVKSHRPITAFHAQDTGSDVFRGDKYLGFRYGDTGPTHGIVPVSAISTDAINRVPLNAVGRHHPGKYSGEIGTGFKLKELGGKANFLFCDGHVEKKHVLETVELRLWGERFYGITGKNYVVKD